MDRRTAVKQLTFLTLSSVAGSINDSKRYLAPAAGTQPTMNVLLHGTFGIIVQTTPNSKYIQLVMPDVGPSHVYTAGDKYDGTSPRPLGNRLRARATYLLDGLDAQNLVDSGNAANIAKTSCQDANVDFIDPNDQTFCRIILPMPRQILPRKSRKRNDGQSWFSTAPKNFRQPDTLPLTVVLKYGPITQIPSFSALDDGRPLWPTSKTQKNGKGNYTLHLRAERDPSVCPPFFSSHFDMLLELLPPLDTTLQMNTPPSSTDSVSALPDPDIDPDEDQTLQEVLLEQTRGRQADRSQQRQQTTPRLCPDSNEISNCQSMILTRS